MGIYVETYGLDSTEDILNMEGPWFMASICFFLIFNIENL